MKKKIFVSVFILFMLVSAISYSQFNPFAKDARLLTAGIGFSGWGIPVYVRYEHPVADYITIGGVISYQSYSEKIISSKWKHSVTGVNGRGSYHFNEILSIPDQWDLYAGASLGYYFWNTKYTGSGQFVYTGSGSGGFSLGGHIGGRYFVNDKIAINLEAGGGTVLAGGTIGVTFIL